MRFFSPLLILVALLAAACGGVVLPDEFTRERADGKIPVSIPLIREQTKKEMDGMPEGQAKVERWQQIEKDHNQCRLLSARSSRAEANEVFAACMSKREYVYMYRLDAEQLHDDIAAQMVAKHKAAEKSRVAAERKEEEKRRVAEKRRREEEKFAETKIAEERKVADLLDSAKRGDAAKVRALLDAGADPNAANKNEFTALMAASQEYPKIVKLLLAAGADPNAGRYDGRTALMMAAQGNNTKVVNVLLAAKANPNAVDNHGKTALMLAAGKGHVQVAKMLLAAEVGVNAVDNRGETALMSAARKYGFSKIAEMLFAAGADPNASANNGDTALMMAAEKGHLKFVKTLLAAGANVEAVDKGGWTALKQAAQAGHLEIAKILLAAGADPNTASNHGWPALIWATAGNQMQIAQMLIAAGANPDFEDDKGYTAWDYALEWPELLAAMKKTFNERQSVDGVSSSKPTNAAAYVFENVWQNIVLIRQGEKQGSGVIVSPNMVATNCHVVDSYGDIIIYKHDNRRATTDTRYWATIRRRDTARDFCLLDVAGLYGIPANARRYRTLNIGEDVYAVGSPKGLDLSLSSGIISQLRQGESTRYIQTDAAISPGSSGGGLFDSDGNLIGILTRKITDEEVEGIGFAIPADLIL